MSNLKKSFKSLILAASSAALLNLGACSTLQPVAEEPQPVPVAPVTPLPPISQPMPVTPAPVVSSGNYHTVVRGDTLYSIGRQYGVHPRDLASWNNIRDYNNYHVKIGEKLRVSP